MLSEWVGEVLDKHEAPGEVPLVPVEALSLGHHGSKGKGESGYTAISAAILESLVSRHS